MEEYEDITDEVKEWLKAVQNKDTAEFLGTGCIKITNGDVLFGVGDTSLIDILDISVFVTPLQYKNIERHKIYRDNIEEAIRAHATSHDYAVRSILWKPLMKNKERVEGEIAGQKISNFLGNSKYIKSQINLMNSNATQKPYLAIGIAKELIESCCKDILQHANVPIDKNWTIQQLVKFTNRELEFSDVNKSVQIILRGLGNIVHGGTELRNQYGSGHGHLSEFKNTDIIFSKLVVSSATAFILFYLEYWKNNINEG